MNDLIVFWMLCLIGGLAVGFGLSYLAGDKIYDKTKDTVKNYIEDENSRKKGE